MRRPRVAASLAAALLGEIFDRPGSSFRPESLTKYSLEIDLDGTARLTTTIVGKVGASSISEPLIALFTAPRARRKLRRRKTRRAKAKKK